MKKDCAERKVCNLNFLEHRYVGDAAASAALVKKREDLRDRREALTNRIQELVDEARMMGERGNVAAAREAVEKADECTVFVY